jgi:hypothetical protein
MQRSIARAISQVNNAQDNLNKIRTQIYYINGLQEISWMASLRPRQNLHCCSI